MRSLLERQADSELATLPETGTDCRHATAMRFHSRAHQGETDPKTAARARRRRIDLHKEIKDVRQLIGGDADARVSNPNNRAPVRHMQRQRELAAHFRVL